jgi:hypothetical protein
VGDDVGLLGHGEVRDRAHARELHLLVDGGRADVERAAEDEREAQDVVDLVREVRAPGRDHGIRPRRLRHVRHDLGLGVGKREDQGFCRHGRQPLGLQHPRRGQPQENIGAGQHLGQRAGVRLLRIDHLVLVHELGAAIVDDALDVGDPDVLAPDAERAQQVEARERGRPRARAHELDLAQLLADDAQPVDDGRPYNDGSAVLVVVKHRDLHALPAFALDLEAFGRLDVLEIDAAEGRLEGDDHVDELVGIALVDLDVEAVEARELLEQHRLAFHDGLGGERADGAEAEHGGAVGDDGNEVAARRERGGLVRVAHDLVARCGNAGRVGEREIALVGEVLRRHEGDLARRRLTVILERGFADVLVRHGCAVLRKPRRARGDHHNASL